MENEELIKNMLNEIADLKKQVNFLMEQNRIQSISNKSGVSKTILKKDVPNSLALPAKEPIEPVIDIHTKFNSLLIEDKIAAALVSKNLTGVDSAVVLGFKPGCGACTEVMKALYEEELDAEIFGTINPTSIYFDKVINTYNIKGSPFLLIISNGKVAAPIVGWEVVQIVKTIIKKQ